MTATSKINGREVYHNGQEWVYSDTDAPVKSPLKSHTLTLKNVIPGFSLAEGCPQFVFKDVDIDKLPCQVDHDFDPIKACSECWKVHVDNGNIVVGEVDE